MIMELTKKLSMLEDVLDTDEGVLKPETVLDDLDSWDSLSRLSLIVMLDESFGKNISNEELKNLKTVADILAYME